MSNHGRRSRGPPPHAGCVAADEVLVGVELVIADPDAVVVADEVVVVAPDDLVIGPDVVLVR